RRHLTAIAKSNGHAQISSKYFQTSRHHKRFPHSKTCSTEVNGSIWANCWLPTKCSDRYSNRSMDGFISIFLNCDGFVRWQEARPQSSSAQWDMPTQFNRRMRSRNV